MLEEKRGNKEGLRIRKENDNDNVDFETKYFLRKEGYLSFPKQSYFCNVCTTYMSEWTFDCQKFRRSKEMCSHIHLLRTIADKDYYLGCREGKIEGVHKIWNDPIGLESEIENDFGEIIEAVELENMAVSASVEISSGSITDMVENKENEKRCEIIMMKLNNNPK